MRRITGGEPVGEKTTPRESDKGVGTGNTGGMRGAKRKDLPASLYEGLMVNNQRGVYVR